METTLEQQMSGEFYDYLLCQPYRSYRMFGRTYDEDVCVLLDKQRHKLLFRLQKRWFGVTKEMEKKGEKQARWIVVSHYNINREYLRRLYRVLRALARSPEDRLQGAPELKAWMQEVRRLIIGSGDAEETGDVSAQSGEVAAGESAPDESARSALEQLGSGASDRALEELEHQAVAEVQHRGELLQRGQCFRCEKPAQWDFLLCPYCGQRLRYEPPAKAPDAGSG